jgi:hypothetical protein
MKRKIHIALTIEIDLDVPADKLDDFSSNLEQAIYEGEAPIEYLNKQGYNTAGIQHMEADVRDEPVCRICGCTEHNACVDEKDGHTCDWSEDDLCSFCVGREESSDDDLPF